MKARRKPRLGFLGVGWIGRARLEAIATAGVGEITVLCDPVATHLEQALVHAPSAAVAPSLDELLGHELDGVVIATPSALHAGQAITALRSGRAVFCQKPLGRDAAEVSAIVEAGRSADCLLGVDLSYRHTAALTRLRGLIRAGELGRIFAVDLIFHNAYGPQAAWFYQRQLSGGGCVIDLGIHLVDAALWILDSAVTGVSSRLFTQGKLLTAEADTVEDFASVRLDLACGAVVQLACSWRLHAGRDAVIEAAFHGTQGGAALRNLHGSFFDFRAEKFCGVKSELVSEPPDAWGGRAAIAWAQQLAAGQGFDPEIERQIIVASVLDQVYGRPSLARPPEPITA